MTKFVFAIELMVTVALGVLGTVLFWMGFVALVGRQYLLAGLPFGALAGLVFLALVYERRRGKRGPTRRML